MRFAINDSQPVYLRLFLLVLAEAIAGVCLYALFGIVPFALQAVIAFMAWVVVRINNPILKKPKSLGSLVSGFTGILIFICSVALHFYHRHDAIMIRLLMVGFCLTAILILLDRRADWD